MTEIKKDDFVELEYTGKTKDDNTVFDTTNKDIAKESGLDKEQADFSPVVIRVGDNSMLQGLEEQMIGKVVGKDYSLEVPHDKAFGKKDTKLIQMIPTNKFKKHNIQPVPGLQLNIDGMFGTIKTVSGGRCMVDFNHPLAGRDLIYDVKVNKVVTDDKEKINSLVSAHLNIHDAKIEVKEGKASIEVKEDIPPNAKEEFKKIALERVSTLKDVSFSVAKK